MLTSPYTYAISATGADEATGYVSHQARGAAGSAIIASMLTSTAYTSALCSVDRFQRKRMDRGHPDMLMLADSRLALKRTPYSRSADKGRGSDRYGAKEATGIWTPAQPVLPSYDDGTMPACECGMECT
eukprot:gene716-2140_t